MSLQEIERAVAALPSDELSRFAAWFDRFRQEQSLDAWDRQMRDAANAGKLDALIKSARAEHRSGKTTRLP